jgi:hypothetical protein
MLQKITQHAHYSGKITQERIKKRTTTSAVMTQRSTQIILDMAEREERWKPIPSSSGHRACLPMPTMTKRRVALGFVVVMEFPICLIDSEIVTGMFVGP